MNVKRIIGTGLVLPLVASIVLVLGAPAYAGHLACGDVITEDAKLDADLSCLSGTALIIGDEDVILDLGGHTLEGGSGGVGVLIQDGLEDITVRNGIIDGFFRGVEAQHVEELVLRNLVIRGQTTPGALGILILDSSEVLIENSSLLGPVPTISVDVGLAILLRFVEDIIVNNVDVHGYRTGVEFACILCDGSEPPSNGTVRNSSFTGNWIGVDLRNTTHAIVSRNHMRDCVFFPGFPCDGISAGFAAPVSGVRLRDNHIHNSRGGILLNDIFDSVITGNHIHNNAVSGIRLTNGSDGNLIRSNLTFGNGVDLFHDTPSTPNKWKNNSCETKSGADIPAC